MATVTKDFKVKNGIKVQGDANIDASLYVAGPNATVNGSDIITEDIITGGTQTNIAVTYNPTTKTLDFAAENGVADSTTSDLAEGTNLYFTDARARNSISVDPAGPITYDSNTGQLDLATGNGLQIGASNELRVKDAYISDIATGVTTSAINALTTSDIEEGTNLYFTAQRAIDAVGGAATSENVADSIVLRDASGNFEAGNITANSFKVGQDGAVNGTLGIQGSGLDISTGGGLILNVGANVLFNLPDGWVSINDDAVVTENATQTLTNKTIGDVLTFNDGAANSTINVIGDDLIITASNDLTLNTQSGDITLNPDGFAYISSTTEANKIATQGYVDNAVAGLAWKESVHLLATTNIELSGATGDLVIDGHEALSDVHGPGYRILVIGQTVATENGIYVYADNGTTYTLTRSDDADTVAELIGAAVFVIEGDQYNATSWVQANHYADTFDDLTWTQFSGTGSYTAGFGINLVGREFSADTTEMATSQALNDAVGNLTDYVDGFLNSNDGTVIEYIDSQDSATLLAANGYSDTLVATGDATATPQYLAINVNDIAKQVAATAIADTTQAVVYEFPVSYRSAKFLVKLSRGAHTDVSEILLTLDTSNNIAITEYAIVGTNGSLGDVTAGYDSANNNVQILVATPSLTTVNVVGTLLV